MSLGIFGATPFSAHAVGTLRWLSSVSPEMGGQSVGLIIEVIPPSVPCGQVTDDGRVFT